MPADPKVAEALVRQLRARGAGARKKAAIPGTPSPELGRVDCVRRGAPVDTVTCKTCTGRVQLKVFACSTHGKCAVGKAPDGVKSCQGCRDQVTDWPKKYSEANLWPDFPGRRFNCSLTPWFGGYAFAYRTGWKGSEVYVGMLDKDFAPVGMPYKLELTHREADYGKEDPRIFVHNGQLHVAFAGVQGGKQIRHTSVLFARLSPGFQVAEVWCPHLDERNLWEKNWAAWSYEGHLLAVYSVRPHLIVRMIDGKAEPFAESDVRFPWAGGELRGGAPPVRVGDEYWHFFHDRVVPDGLITYRTGLYTFGAKPPFRPLRYVPEPILTADAKTKPADQYCACLFVGAAVRAGDDWVLAHGVHDRWSELHKIPHAALEARLLPVEGAPK